MRWRCLRARAVASARVRRFAGCSSAPCRGARAVRVGSPPPTRTMRFLPPMTTVVSMRWSGPRTESAATAVASLTVEAGVAAVPWPRAEDLAAGGDVQDGGRAQRAERRVLQQRGERVGQPRAGGHGGGATARGAGRGGRRARAARAVRWAPARGQRRDARHWHRPSSPPPCARPYADPSPTGRPPPPRRARPPDRWLRRPPSAARSAGYGAVWPPRPAARHRPRFAPPRPLSAPSGPQRASPPARTAPPTAI